MVSFVRWSGVCLFAGVVGSAVLSLSCGSGGGGGGTPTPTAGPKVCTLGLGVQNATCGAGAWAENTHYLPGETVTYGGRTYQCIQDHSSTPANAPPKAPTIWSDQGAQDVPQLGDAVNAAIDKLVQDQPAVFDKNQEQTPGAKDYLIVDYKGYFAGLVANLKAAGYCAEADIFNDHRIKIKNLADFSEDYNVASVDFGFGSFIQKSPASFDRTCRPAAFPLDRNPDVPPPDQGCFEPYPPAIGSFGIKLFVGGGGSKILDSTPQILGRSYCASIGYSDGRSFCPLRPEGEAQRVPCEGWRVGIAQDTGRLGPTWARDGKPCTGPDSGCDNNPHNQYQLIIYYDNGNTHTYTACTDENFCGTKDIDY